MTGTTLRSEPRRRSCGRRRSAWSPKRLSNLRAWYDAELGQPKYSGVGAYVQLDGTPTDNISTPDSVATSFSNDIEVIMRVYVNDWTAAANQTLCGKYLTTGNQRSWRFYISTTGTIGLTASVDGTAVTSIVVTPTTPFVDATWYWLRLRLDLTNGANSVGTVEYAADTGDNTVVPTVWTANGTNTGTTIAGIFDSTAVTEVGGFTNGTLERLSGRVGRFILRSGFDGTTVADFNASDCYGDGYWHSGGYQWTLGLPKIYDRSGNNRPPATFGSGSNQPLWLPWTGRSQVYLPGGTGNFVTSEVSALFAGATQIDGRIACSLAPGVSQALLTHGGSNTSWRLTVAGSLLYFDLSSATASPETPYAISNAAMPAGEPYCYRVTWDSTTGDTKFWHKRIGAADPMTVLRDNSGWTQLGSTVSHAAGKAIKSSTVAVGLGAYGTGGTGGMQGPLFGAMAATAIDGAPVYEFDAALCSQSGYVDGVGSAGLQWALQRAATGGKPVVQSPAARSARSVILHRIDDWIDVPAAAIPDLTGQPFSHLSIARFHGTPTINTRIVSMKDGASFASVAYWQTGANGYSHYIGVPTAPNTTVVQGLRHAFYAGGNGVDTSYHAVDDGAVTTQTGLTVRDATSARIGAEPVTGGNYADMEFEALILRDVDTSVLERDRLVRYYRGGV